MVSQDRSAHWGSGEHGRLWIKTQLDAPTAAVASAFIARKNRPRPHSPGRGSASERSTTAHLLCARKFWREGRSATLRTHLFTQISRERIRQSDHEACGNCLTLPLVSDRDHLLVLSAPRDLELLRIGASLRSVQNSQTRAALGQCLHAGHLARTKDAGA